MDIAELKKRFHALIERTSDAEMLKYGLAIMSGVQDEHAGVWDSLSDEQKQKVLLGYEQSLNQANLVPNDEVQKQMRQWLMR